MKHCLVALAACLSLAFPAMAQQSDPALFTVAGKPVALSEFKYIYEKTNGAKADYSKASVEEYLELYTKFKLKVQKARDMRLDTITSLKNELEGYRKQLANSYLVDKEVTDKLIQEAYERSAKDVDFSHILVRAMPQTSPADTLVAYKKIQAALDRLKKGEDWNKVVKEVSEDVNNRDQGGRVGYVTAVFPNGFYSLENAAYATPKGKISGIIRTDLGYHIIRVEDIRDARGEMEIAHIMIRKNDSNGRMAKSRIDSIYQVLGKGESFDDLAKKVSEDNNTKSKGGYLGFFGINKYDRSFEDAAFALKKDGDYSAPVETKLGWHIIKRIKKKEQESYEVARRRLQNSILKDSRFEMSKLAMVGRIKTEQKYSVNQANLDAYLNALDTNFLTFRWKAPESGGAKPLFTLGGNNFLASQFSDYLVQNQRSRLRQANSTDRAAVGRKLFDEWVDESAMQFEEKRLEQKYPEFKALMREYEEGILLFEATRLNVWDKASQDSVGLNTYYEGHKSNYMWEERAVIHKYTIKSTDEKVVKNVLKALAKDPLDKAIAKINKKEPVLVYQEVITEKSNPRELGDLPWAAGSMSTPQKDEAKGETTFTRVEKLLEPTPKSLKESRGYVIADYQDYLEKSWIQDLQKAYPIKIDQEVLKSILQK